MKLNVTIIGQGSTNPPVGTYDILAGQVVSVAAYPAAGYRFRTWTWPSNPDPNYNRWTENPTTWVMVEPISIVAVFDLVSTPPPPPPSPPPPTTGIISIGSNPMGANLVIDGVQVGPTPQTVELSLGIHTIVLSMSGYTAITQTIDVVGNDSITIALEPVTGPPPPPPSTGWKLPTWAWIGGIVALGLLLVKGKTKMKSIKRRKR